MNCPVCTDTALVMSERSGIEIDYCPKCRGVWLDRGELDKIIERAAGQPAPTAAPPMPPPVPHHQQQHYQRPMKPDDSHYGYETPYGKRKKSWLSEIFD